MNTKVKEKTLSAGERIQLRHDYWTALLEVFKRNQVYLFDHVGKRTQAYYLWSESQVPSVAYMVVFKKSNLAVSMEVNQTNKDHNKMTYDLLFQHKDDIEQRFGAPLHWLRAEKNESSKISYVLSDIDSTNLTQWSTYIAWHLDYIQKLVQAINSVLPLVEEELAKFELQKNETKS